MQKFFLNNFFSIHSSSLIVGLSGGPDSVFLVHFLQEKFPKTKLILAHFNHQLREKESNEDAAFCEQFAKSQNFLFEKEDWGNPSPSEEKARNARYEFLERVRAKHNAQWITIAHHQDDAVETIILQFFRSGGLDAMKGLSEFDKSRSIWRPLLNYKKSDILEFLEQRNIAYRNDSSNADPQKYTRNFLRLNIIPLLEEKFPAFGKRMVREGKRIQEVLEFLEKEACQFLETFPEKQGIPVATFLSLPSQIQRIIVKKITNDPFGELSYFDGLICFLQRSSSGKRFTSKHYEFLVYGEKLFAKAKDLPTK